MSVDRRWIVVWIVITGLALLGLGAAPKGLLVSYLAIWFAFASIPIGSIGLLMTSYLIRGRWTYDAHRPLAYASLTIPVAGILFIPALIGLSNIYPCVDSREGLSGFQHWLLNPPSFIIRSMIYFVILTLVGRWAAFAPPGRYRQMRVASIGLIVWVLVVSFAGIDWIESIEPDFHSSTFGLLVVSFTTLSACGFLLVWLATTRKLQLADNAVYGGILLTTLLIWAYLHAMQYIIIWAGNLPDEVHWYLERLSNGWSYPLWGLYIFQFVLPFFLLLSASIRQSLHALLWLGLLTLACRCLEAVVLVGAAIDSQIPLLLSFLLLALVVGSTIMVGAQIVPSTTARTSQ